MASPAQAKVGLGAASPASTGITPENYTYLQQIVYKDSGIVLEHNKHYLLESRLHPIVKREQLASLDDLCNRLRCEPKPVLRKNVVEAMTTNETLFFRDRAPFDALRDHLVPKLQTMRAQTKKLSFWSAASSSGQEAYSLAILLLELGLRDWKIEIVGTDLSGQMVERARLGKYMQIEVNRGLPAPYLVKYFVRDGMNWQLKPEVRNMVRFQTFDLRQSLRQLGTFDVVFCRNVLIYFDVDTKRQILAEICKVMNPGGYLVLGGAETTVNLNDRLKRTPIGQAVFYENS